jgi:hypothetical protein
MPTGLENLRHSTDNVVRAMNGRNHQSRELAMTTPPTQQSPLSRG